MATINSINQASEALVLGPIGVDTPDPNTYLLRIQKNQAAGTGLRVLNNNSGGFAFCQFQADGSGGGGIQQYGSAYSDSYGAAGTTVFFSNAFSNGLNLACENGTMNLRVGNSGAIQASLTTTGGQYRGYNSNTAPAAGYIGELISSGYVTTGTLSNSTYTNITSVSLTAGLWDLSAYVEFDTTGTVTGNTQWIGVISASSASGTGTGENGVAITGGNIPVNGSNGVSISPGPTRVSLSSTTTIYLNCRGYASVTFSNVTSTGLLRAHRVA